MKIITAVVLVVVYVAADSPPSNSYLPPPRAGYSQSGQNGLVQIVSARSQGLGRPDHGVLSHGANGFARSSPQPGYSPGQQKAAGRTLNRNVQGYGNSLTRNALEDGNAEPASYNFGYMVNDQNEGTDFGHHEQRQEEHAQGQYHVVLPDGRKQTVNYEADEGGFKPQVSYEDSEDITRSGYDNNASNFHSGQDGRHGYHDNGNVNNGNNFRSGQDGNHQDGRHGYHDNGNVNSQNGGYARSGY